MFNDTGRRPGEALSAERVRQLREGSGLTQEELASRLGLSGGKAVISGWETGRTRCEGPAAELLLILFGRGDTSGIAETLRQVDEAWRRPVGSLTEWRQITAVPDVDVSIERESFARLFPDLAVPSKEIVHGFPFVRIGNHDVYSIGPSGWRAEVPSDPERRLSYYWLFTRSGRFAYRERVWEGDEMSVTRGHTRVRSLAILALATTHFFKRIVDRGILPPTASYTLQIDMEGMKGRGVVIGSGASEIEDELEDGVRVTTESHVAGRVRTTLGDLSADPVRFGLDLVGEVILYLLPEHASDEQLRMKLGQYRDEDEGGLPRLGFLKRGAGQAERRR